MDPGAEDEPRVSHLLFNYDGEPISPEEWSGLMIGRASGMVRWRVGLTEVESYEVSTVWTGIDVMSTLTGGEPMIFETLVNGPDGCEWGCKYASAEEAFEGHQAVVETISYDPVGWRRVHQEEVE